MLYICRTISKSDGSTYVTKLDDKKWLKQSSHQVEHLLKHGRVNVWTPGGPSVVKPRNVLIVPTGTDFKSIVALLTALPWSVDLRTVDIADYPEFFI
jgi:hypothetical protein